MIFEGMTTMPINDEEVVGTLDTSEPKIIGPKEFYERSIETQIKQINRAMQAALVEGKINFEVPIDMHVCLKKELENAGWIVGGMIRNTEVLLDESNFILYETRLEMDNNLEPQETKDDNSLFITAEEYYIRVRRQQIILINKCIEEEIRLAKYKEVYLSNLSFTLLPNIREMLKKSGWTYESKTEKLRVNMYQEKEYNNNFYEQKDKKLSSSVI